MCVSKYQQISADLFVLREGVKNISCVKATVFECESPPPGIFWMEIIKYSKRIKIIDYFDSLNNFAAVCFFCVFVRHPPPPPQGIFWKTIIKYSKRIKNFDSFDSLINFEAVCIHVYICESPPLASLK